MEILVFSDSHGHLLDMYALIEHLAPDAVIHLGDYYEDARALRRSYPDMPVYAVQGNNDREPDAPAFLVITLAGVRMYLTHGHREYAGFRGAGHVAQYAAEQGCMLAFYGHTHLQHDEEELGVRVMNPGSISMPRRGRPSCLKLNVQGGKLLQAVFLDHEGAPYTDKRHEKKRFGWF